MYNMATAASGAATASLDQQSTRDSFIPIFDGTLAGYKEWRKRITIYAKKMELTNRKNECVLNLLGSLQGTAWKLVEDFDLEKAKEETAFKDILSLLDSAFQYDSKVELPADFSSYFEASGRRSGQTMLQYITDHDERLRRLEKHGVTLPAEVQGWHLLAKANITKEQRQMVMTQANSLERTKIQQAMYSILGQDYKHSHLPHNTSRWLSSRPSGSGKGRGFYADEDDAYDDEDGWGFMADDDDMAYYEYDGNSWDNDEYADFDADAAYFQEPSNDPAEDDFGFDPAEYDECFASYMDARKRFNELRMSRGFFPVVAYDPNAAGSSNTGQSPMPPKGKGKKGKSKGRGKNNFRYNKPPMKPHDPKGRAQAAIGPQCLRCGSLTHKTAQCTQSTSKPTPKASPAGPNKRQATEGVASSSMMDPENGMVIFEDQEGSRRPDCAMMDPGASSFLMGFGPLSRYIDHLKKLQFPVHEIVFKKANRTFHFGGDHKAISSWTVHLPIFVNHKFGLVQAFLLRGETPMLLGRPISKALGMAVDFLNDRIKFDGSEWRDATLGRHHEYLLPLTEDYDPSIIADGAAFDLVLEDEDGPNFFLEHFQHAENVFMDGETAPPEGTLVLKGKQLKSLDTSVLTRLKAAEAYIAQTLHDMEQRRPRKLWEVYCGHGRTSNVAASFGMETQVFGFETGWNFSLKSHQRAFMDLLAEELPDEVLMSPTCAPWSPMQNANMKDERKCQQLQQLREWHHRVHLKFCRKVYMEQLSEGRHAHLEQPTPALSWRTSALKDLPGHRARFHQCQYGCVCQDNDGLWRPVRKDTTILTSKTAVAQAMNLLCPGDHQHCRLEGHMKGFRTLKTSFMEDYQPAMAATLAAALATPETPHPWDFGFAVQEIKEHAGKMIDLHVEGKAEALRVVQKLHRNLGHPSTKSLVELLQSRNASEAVIQIAGSYVYAACQRYRKPNQPAPATLSDVESFNQKVQSDVFWIKDGKTKYPILSNIDMATKYQTATLLRQEKTDDFITGFERSWIAHFGPPATLVTDEGRGWLSDKMSDWTDAHSIFHEVAPGEAHTRLSLVERRHAVLRKSLEVYMMDLDLHGPDGLRTALTYILPQLNAQPTVSGFSPSQWLLGFQPSIGNLLTSDQITPAHLSGGASFEQALHRRNVAKAAILQADTDQRLRRALLRRYAGANIPLTVGQTCFFWRDARESDLVKIRWKGPAKVLMVETDGDGKPSCYWVYYKTQLIRCAPHHCRPDFHTLATNAVDNLQEAKAVIQQIKSRGVTRYLDLSKVNKQHIDDVGEDEEMISNSSGGEQAAKRRRLDLSPAPSVSYEPSLADEFEVPVPPEPQDAGPAMLPATATQHGEQQEPGDADFDGNSDEPSAELFPPPALPDQPSLPPQPSPDLHPQQPSTSAAETFQQRRDRMDRQEMLPILFGPNRRQRSHDGPYVRPDNADDLANVAFQVEDISTDGLPADWHFNAEAGFFELRPGTTNRDFWEIKSGCLLRHHVQPRKTLFDPHGFADIPIPVENLDSTRVTVHRTLDGQINSFSDDFRGCQHFTKDLRKHRLPQQWFGITVFQICAETRKELGMSAFDQRSSAKKVAQDTKVQQKRTFRRDYAKAKGEVSEKNLTQAEKELFYHAKVKELKSFFECGVWEFATTSDSIPERTLTSRMLLKWSKYADGTPRAKARLVVRGFNDVDALNGELPTASPTTSRLSRSLLLSISSCLHWKAWAADVATAFLQGLPQERSLWLKLPAQALEILGASPDTRMFLKKPVYGQIDAPRRWYLEALRRLESLNWKRHQLDPCCFMLYDENVLEGDFPKLVGILILHVDDMLAAGDESSATYVEAERKLKEVFNFRTWQDDKQVLEYCGVQLERKDHAWSIHQESYWHKVKPVTIHKGRSAEDEMNEHDKTQLRALLGSLQWPAVQTAPHVQCSASLISGMQKTNKLRAIFEANLLLKFAKQNLDLRLRYVPLKINSLDDLRLCIMFDAAHGVREDHTSQGGYLAFLTTDEIFQTETDYHVLEWRSFKLPRVARSSLSAEAQACGQSADIAEYIARFWSCLRRPTEKLRDCMDEVSTLKPCLITDAKALYDSYHKESLAGSSSVDKRTGLEIRVAREQVSSLGGSLRWVSSERQYADSLTKMSSRSLLAERIRFHKMKLIWDSVCEFEEEDSRRARSQ